MRTFTESAPFFGANIIAGYSVGSFDAIYDSAKDKISDVNVQKKLTSTLETLNEILVL